MYFSELEKSLRDLKASFPLMPGDHRTSGIGLEGNLAVTSRPFDRRLGDTYDDIDPFEPYVNGTPQVTLFLEQAPMILNVLCEPDSIKQARGREMVGNSFLKSIDNQINNTEEEINESLRYLRTGTTDLTSRYYADNYDLVPNNFSFIIDGSNFDLFDPNMMRRTLKRYIGIRVLHEIEVEVPANIGTFQTGDSETPHLNTNSPVDLAKHNKKLSVAYPVTRKRILDKWQDRLRLVDVVCNPITGINVAHLDHHLAIAVQEEWL